MSPTGKKWFAAFAVACLLVSGLDLVFHRHHSAYVWETWPGWYGAYGFVSVSGLVFVSKFLLRPLVMRREEDV